MKLVECVPNFSEGRDGKIIDGISAAISSVEGVTLLDVDPGAATNRTVFTMVGEPDRVLEAAFQAIRVGTSLIDMTRHKGEHPRNGACDVCPFVPISGVTMDDCVDLARRLGERVGSELGIPVYLYEYAATRPERRNLADIRTGEYEALPGKLGTEQWAPDFGPNQFNPRSGATQIGARDFLIAYNINLNTRNVKIAKDIANQIREKGRFLRNDAGKKVKGPDGEFLREPGLFKNCKATGWFIDEYKCAQVTMNLTDFHVTPPHLVFDAVCDLAARVGCRVTGSELVGLMPLDAVLQAGSHYLKLQGASRGVTEAELVEMAIRSMGLADVSEFDPDRKIIEYVVGKGRTPLMDMGARAFVDELSSDSPAPGGGSVAALCGAMSAGLSAMVASLTFSKKGMEQLKEEMDQLGMKAQELKKWFSLAVDRDTDAFNQVMAAIRLPKSNDQEIAVRNLAIRDANRGAASVPLEVMEASLAVAGVADAVIRNGNPNSLSDAGVAGLCARTAALGAYYNVLINIRGMDDDQEFAAAARTRATSLLGEIQVLCESMEEEMERRLQPGQA